MVSVGRTRGNGHELKHRKFPVNIRKNFFTVRATEHWCILPRAGVLDQTNSRSPFQPQPFSESVAGISSNERQLSAIHPTFTLLLLTVTRLYLIQVYLYTLQ